MFEGSRDRCVRAAAAGEGGDDDTLAA